MKVRFALLVLVLFFSAAPAFSQGCAMCRNSAAATSKEGQRAISKGVLMLVLPPAGFMTLGVALAFRYGRKRDLENC
jgi:Na+-translocating ferredoxin:NAD+ oxidoreductase RnfE subunit